MASKTDDNKILAIAYLLTQTMTEKELLKICIVLLKGIFSGWKKEVQYE